MEVTELHRFVAYSLAQQPVVAAVVRQLADFVQETSEFDRLAQQGADRSRLQRALQEVERSWDRLTIELNRLPNSAGLYLVRARAQRVEAAGQVLHRLLGLPGEMPRTLIQLPTSLPETKGP